MSNSLISSTADRQQEAGENNIRLDFKVWLTSLQSGNLLSAKTAFKALKKDFENSPEASGRQTLSQGDLTGMYSSEKRRVG